MPGSFFVLDRHVGSYVCQCVRNIVARSRCTFFASFLAFFCFAADAFSILCRRRTGTRLDFGSRIAVRGFHMCDSRLDLLPTFIVE